VLSWNADHLVTGVEFGSPPHARLDLLRAYQSWVLLLPVIGALALPATLALGVEVVRERGADRWRVLLLLWTLSAAVALFATREWTLRHSAILFLPGHLVLGWALWRAWQAIEAVPRHAAALRAGTLGLVALAGGVGIAGQAHYVVHRTYEIRDIAQLVRAAVGPRPAVFVGRFAVPLLLATPYDVFYVKRGFNTEPEQIRALGITHALRRNRDVVDRYLQAARLPPPKSLEVLEYRQTALALQSFEDVDPDRVRAPRRGLRATSDDRIDRDEGEGDRDGY
jgi:hypothetical protein